MLEELGLRLLADVYLLVFVLDSWVTPGSIKKMAWGICGWDWGVCVEGVPHGGEKTPSGAGKLQT